MAKLTQLPSRFGNTPSKLPAPPKVAERFYSSREWRATVARIKRKRGHWCERCGSTDRVIADHKVERRDGGAEFDEDNIELLCAAHHNAKTAQARARRAQGEVHGAKA